MAHMIKVKRVYEPPSEEDGKRYLVDRLWPRGIKKEKLVISGWLKDIAPSDGLRKWFGHKPERWEEFKRKYHKELEGKTDTLGPILEALKEDNVTLLFGAKDVFHNNAVALKEYIERNFLSGK